jgi:hypothetical protein
LLSWSRRRPIRNRRILALVARSRRQTKHVYLLEISTLESGKIVMIGREVPTVGLLIKFPGREGNVDCAKQAIEAKAV